MEATELLVKLIREISLEELIKALEGAGLTSGQLYPKQNTVLVRRTLPEIPVTAQGLPEAARVIFKQAFEDADPAIAEAEAFSKAWAAVNELYEPTAVSGWVVKRFTDPLTSRIDQLRRQLRTDGYPEASDALGAEGVDVKEALSSLPDGYRETIELRYAHLNMDTEPVVTDALTDNVSEITVGKESVAVNFVLPDDKFEVQVAFKAISGDEKKVTYGVVYPAYDHDKGEKDLQKEWARPDVIETAAHNFLDKWRQHDVFHNEQPGYGTPVESYIAPCDISEFHGKTLEKPISKGSWIMATRWNDKTWELVKSGKIAGYSIGGYKRIAVKEKA